MKASSLWKIGLYAVVCYIPIAGAISLKLYPALWPKEISDFLFIIPAYLVFLSHPKIWRSFPLHIPRLLLGALGGLTLLVILEAFNPQVLNWRVAAIGVKVWLFYLPLVILGYFWVETRGQLLRLFRLLMALSWIPSMVGFIQFVGSHWFGYRPFMTLFYGKAAEGATQGFTLFKLGSGTMLRIPSTFAFSTQYMNYLMAMTALSYAFMQSEQSPAWKRFGHITFYWIVLATFLCGSRAAFVATPLMVMALCFMNKNVSGGIYKTLATFLLMFIALKLPTAILSAKVFVQNQSIHTLQTPTGSKPGGPEGKFSASSYIALTMPYQPSASQPVSNLPKETADISLGVWGRMMESLIVHHGYSIGYMNILAAFRDGLLGEGTGRNTGAARFAVSDPSQLSGFENYYAKTIVELGVLGLLIVITLLSSLLIGGFEIHRGLSEPFTREVSAAICVMLATFTLYNFKGLMIDLEPMNIYFWLFSGILFRLPYLR